mgnify:CR=1 FL=1
MTNFDFNQAVGQTFLTDGGKPFGLRLWFWLAACYSVVNLIGFPMIAEYYPALLDLNWQNMQATQAGEIPSEQESMEILRLFGKMIPAYLILTIGMWVSIAMCEAALHRRNFFGAEHPKAPIRFGKQELQLMLVQLGVCLLITLIYIVSIFVFVLITALLALVIKGFAAVVAVLGVFGLFGFLIYCMVRLAPAGAMTVERGTPTLFAVRPVAKGRFWSLFLAYLVVSIGGYIASYIVMAIASGFFVGNADAVMAIMGLGTEPPSTVFADMGAKMKNPIFVFIAVLAIIAYSAVYALVSLSLSGIGSYALKWYRQDNPA